jgi:putative SOS response-associated peptidase YedK
MCGRYYRRSDKQRIAEAFRLGILPEDVVLPGWDPNVSPTTFQPVIRADKETGERELAVMRWGLVPFFTKDLKDIKGASTINARAETLEKSPMWRGPFKKRRCLVPADGFYEWKKLDAKRKQPYAFLLRSQSPFAFAGLWDAWRDPKAAEDAPGGGWLQSFTIVTTEANELVAPMHDRMPVILEPRDYDRWLDREAERPPLDLLRPLEAGEMAAVECDPKEMTVDGPPVAAGKIGTLF